MEIERTAFDPMTSIHTESDGDYMKQSENFMSLTIDENQMNVSPFGAHDVAKQHADHYQSPEGTTIRHR